MDEKSNCNEEDALTSHAAAQQDSVATSSVRGEAARRTFLEREPSSVGVEWATALCETTTKEGRAVEGGWPGTLPEARSLVTSRLNDNLAARHRRPLTESELGEATNAAYARARQVWLDVARARRQAARRRPIVED
jgi:hypothetical protein